MFYKRWSFWAVFLLGLVPLIWYRDGLPIAGGDNYYLLNPRPLFFDFLHTWIGRTNLGVPNLQTSLLFPYTFFWYFFGLFGLSPFIIELLWSIALFLLPGLAIYLLFGYLQKSAGSRLGWGEEWACLAVAVWYMFNTWVMVDVLATVSRLIAGLLPLFLLFWIKGLEAEKFHWRYPFSLGLLSLFLSSTYAQPVAAISIPFAGGVYLFLFLGRTRRFAHAVKVGLSSLFFFLIFNLWWFFPYFLSMRGLYASFEGAARSHQFLYATPIFEAFRFLGFWAFRMQFDAQTPHVPYAPLFYEPLFIVLTYVLTLTALAALLLKPRHKYVVYLAFLGLLGVFLAKGANPPLGGIYRFLYENVPGFAAFREPYARFTGIAVFSFSLLLGFSLQEIFRRFSPSLATRVGSGGRVLLKTWPLLFVGAILLLAHPLLTGQVIQDTRWHGLTYESLHVAVPAYWEKLAAWLTQGGEIPGKILLLPRTPYGHCYRWRLGMCAGGAIAPLFLARPLVLHPETALYPGDELIQDFYQRLALTTDYNLSPLFDLLGISHVLTQNDIVWERNPFDIKDPPTLAKLLAAQKDLVFKGALGNLDLYEYLPRNPWPKVFPVRRSFYISGSADSLPDKVLLQGNFAVGDVYLFSPLNTDKPLFVDFESSAETASGKKFTLQVKSPSRYQIFIKETGTKFLLPGQLRYRLDGQPLAPSAQGVVGRSWYSLGIYPLDKGKHVLEIDYPPAGNWLSAEGFFNGRLQPLGAEEPPQKEPLPRGASATWLLPEPAGTAVSFIPLQRVLAGNSYRLSFWYKNIKGAVPYYGISENNCAVPLSKSDFDGRLLSQVGCQTVSWAPRLETSLEWRRIETTVKLRDATRSAFVFFQFDSPAAVLAVSGVSLEPLFDWALTARDEESAGAIPEARVPQVSYRQLNPAKYHVFVRGQAPRGEIVLNESFNGNWKVYPLPRGGLARDWPLATFFLKALPEKQHFVANGFANGWEIQSEDFMSLGEDREFIIEYQPQRFYLLGLFLLLGGVSLSVFFGASSKIFRKGGS